MEPGTARPWQVHLAAAVCFLGVGLLATWPLALHLNQLPGELGDNVYFAFLTRWYPQALLNGQSPWFHSGLNYPAGWHLASTDLSPAAVLPGVPFALLFGGAAGLNAAMLFSFMLSGWAMFAWLRSLTGSNAAGLAAGLAYTLLPYHMAHYTIGHLNLAALQWYPLFFWGLHDLLRTPRLAWKPALLCGLSLGLIALTSMYMLYITLLVAAVFAGSWLLLGGWRILRRPLFWLNGALAGLAALPFSLTGILPYRQAGAVGGLAARSLDYAAQNSASPTDYLLPWPGSLLWHASIAPTYLAERWQEQSLYLGALVLGLALLGAVLARGRENRRLIAAAGLAALAAFVLSLGVYLQWAGQTVLINDAPLSLPGRWLFENLPWFNRMRALARFGFYVSFFAVLAAGLGFHALLRRTAPARRLPLTLAVLFLIALDFAVLPGRTFTSLAPLPADRWLAAQPGKAALAVFPFRRQADQDLVYRSLDFRKPYIGGFFSANTPDQYWQIQPALDTFPSPEALSQLRVLGVGYALVERSSYPAAQALTDACNALGMPLLYSDADTLIFGVPETAGAQH